MKRNSTPENPDWNLSFWFAALSPFIGVGLGFVTAAAMMRGLWSNSSKRPGASIWDIC